jgi:hypothetical protein
LGSGISANENNAVAFYSNRLGLRRSIVGGVDVSVFEDDIRRG